MEVTEALELYEEAKSYWSDIYEAWREDVRFSIGLDHWTDKDLKSRGADNCLIVPILPQFIHQVVNDMRMNTPSINVIPASEGSAEETAEIFKGLIRNIEYKSKSDAVYDTAGEYAVRGGLGFARIDHDYVNEKTFDQELKLIRVQNPQSIYLDPSYVECDGSDAEWAIVLDTMTVKQFKKDYPNLGVSSFGETQGTNQRDEITIAEVFVKKYTTVEREIDESGTIRDAVKGSKLKKRKMRKVTIHRYKFSGSDMLEETTFPGKYIPIVPFLGEEVWIDGQRHLLSLIRLAKDAQRRVNKWASKESEILDMAPISPVQAPVGAVDDFMEEWGKQGEVNVMRYRMFDEAGNALNKPERLPPPQIPTGIINAMQGAKENVKEALGMYNASIGQRSNAISGVAYDAQKLEADVATFHFADNRNRSIQQIGRILVCAIPEIYDTERVIQVIGTEEQPEMVGINGRVLPGQEYNYDLKEGEYDVRVTTGASYTTKRQEAAALLGELIKQDPQAKMIFGDLWAKNLDVAGAEAIADRFKKVMPPGLAEDEDNPQAPDPQKMQMEQVIQQMQQQIQAMGAELQSKQAEYAIKQGELQVKQEEAAIKAGELKLKYLTASKPEQPLAGAQVAQSPMGGIPLDAPIEVFQAALESKITAEQQAAMQAEQEAYNNAYLEQNRAQKEAEEKAMELAEMQQRQMQAEAVIQTLQVMSAQLGNLTASVAQPKQVIRQDPNDPLSPIIGVR
jgi:tetratricopeptide (TPR) repeat protein